MPSPAHPQAKYRLDPHFQSLYYLEQGAGPPLLLLHGNGAQASLYQALIDALSPHFRVLAPDLPGYGYSPTLWPLKLEAYLSHLERFICAHIQEPFCLIGHSLGGLLAYCLMQRRRVPPLQKAVWMEAILFEPDWRIRTLLPGYGRLYRHRKHRFERLEAGTYNLVWDRAQCDPVFFSRFLTCYLEADVRVQAMFFEQFPQLLPWQLDAIETPLLCVRGEKETFISKVTSQFVPQLKQAREVVIPRSGHFLIGEQNAALFECLLAFLVPHLSDIRV